jgi:hypothetical protein
MKISIDNYNPRPFVVESGMTASITLELFATDAVQNCKMRFTSTDPAKVEVFDGNQNASPVTSGTFNVPIGESSPSHSIGCRIIAAGGGDEETTLNVTILNSAGAEEAVTREIEVLVKR